MAHLIKARDISLFASKSLNTETDPWSKHRSTTLQGHVEKKFQNGNKRELSDFGRMATAEFKKQLEKAKGKLGAMRAGVYKLMWNAIFDKLTGEHPYQSFGDVIEGYPFTTRITNRTILYSRWGCFFPSSSKASSLFELKELELVNIISLQNSQQCTRLFSAHSYYLPRDFCPSPRFFMFR